MSYQVKCESCNKVLDVKREPYQGAMCMSCIDNNLDIVVMSAPKEIGFFDENSRWISPMSYLIQNLDGKNYLIHRELALDELCEYDDDQTFYYRSQKYLKELTNMPSKEAAEEIIKSWWNAFNELKNFENKRDGKNEKHSICVY